MTAPERLKRAGEVLPPRAGAWPGAWIVPQALAEIEALHRLAERLPRQLRDGTPVRAAIRRGCRHLTSDFRGLGRLLEGEAKRP